jgi:hypothetical protein
MILVAVIGVLGIVAGAVIGPVIQHWLGAPPSGYELVPYVVNLDINTAIKQVEKLGFRPGPEPHLNNTVLPNIVFAQIPAANTPLPPDEFVWMLFNAGNSSYPYFTGITPGSGVIWSQNGFSVQGNILNYQPSQGNLLFLLSQPATGGEFLVQDSPFVNVYGAWTGAVQFGGEQFKPGDEVKLILILTRQQLVLGQQLATLPRDSVVSYDLTLTIMNQTSCSGSFCPSWQPQP